MPLADFGIDSDEVVQAAKGVKVVGLQFPEGLRRFAPELAATLEGTGIRVVVSADPCFGACDLDLRLLDRVDRLFHFGHAPIPSLVPPGDRVVFFESQETADPLPLVDQAVALLESPVMVTAAVQYRDRLPAIKARLQELDIALGSPGPTPPRLVFPEQVLGCCFPTPAPSQMVASILYIGSGVFHPLGLAFSSDRPVIRLDPTEGRVVTLTEEKDRFLRQRFGLVAAAMDAERFIIVGGSKPGQARPELSERLAEHGRAAGKAVMVVETDLTTPERLLHFRTAEVFVNTSCPRVAFDDALRHGRPLLTPHEFLVAIGVAEWEPYRFDTINW